MATHRGFTFRARVTTIVTGCKGPGLVVTAVRREDWHKLPASSVVVEPSDFVQGLDLQRFTLNGSSSHPWAVRVGDEGMATHRGLTFRARVTAPALCPNCGQRHGADSHGCTDGG